MYQSGHSGQRGKGRCEKCEWGRVGAVCDDKWIGTG